ncbi:MAG: hypothetical protein JJ992_17335, partial [Planctomycetes bacterium]|nr:hypothetical protein [Planctomycetota bacterium]
RESRGDLVYVRKMTKALKQSMPRLKKSVVQKWTDDSLAVTPWSELTADEQSLHDFWCLCLAQPSGEEAIPTFKTWLQNRDSERAWSVWETWHLLSLIYLGGRHFPDGLFWELWNLAARAFTQVRDQLDPPDGAEGTLDQFLIAGVELRWLALAVFPEIEHAARLPKQARQALTSWHDSFLTKDQKPLSGDLPRLPDVWRSLARTADICERLKQEPFRKTDHRALRKLLVTTCRITRPDGRLLGSESEVPWAYLYALGKQVAAKKPDGLKSLLKSYQAQQHSLGKVSKSRKSGVPNQKPSHQTDDGKWAVLRSKWTDKVDACLVQHDSPAVRLECQAGSQTVISGNWEVQIEIEGQKIPLLDEWEAVCWHSDRDGDYLELQQKLSGEVTLERQLFLSRTDQFLYAAEVVHAPDDREVTVTSTLPLDASINTQQDRYTREWKLKRKKKSMARLFPLAFEQEIVHKTEGTLSVSAEKQPIVTMERTGRGSQYLPLIVDWHPHHQAAPAEWKKLTVTQSRQVCPPTNAGGYRLRMAEQHLLVFRSLVKPYSPRAVLGHHTMHESLIAKFDDDGDVAPLLIVE